MVATPRTRPSWAGNQSQPETGRPWLLAEGITKKKKKKSVPEPRITGIAPLATVPSTRSLGEIQMTTTAGSWVRSQEKPPAERKSPASTLYCGSTSRPKRIDRLSGPGCSAGDVFFDASAFGRARLSPFRGCGSWYRPNLPAAAPNNSSTPIRLRCRSLTPLAAAGRANLRPSSPSEYPSHRSTFFPGRAPCECTRNGLSGSS